MEHGLACKFCKRTPATFDPIVRRLLCYDCRKILCASRSMLKLLAERAILSTLDLEESLGQSD